MLYVTFKLASKSLYLIHDEERKAQKFEDVFHCIYDQVVRF